MITAGLDCGAQNTKTIILRDGKIIAKALVPTGFDLEKAAQSSLAKALAHAGVDRAAVNHICGTGAGRNAIKIAGAAIDEIQAMGKGAVFYFPNARTVADVGAEDGRAAKLDERGNVADFVVNERCAAGAGVFIEAMGRALDTPLEEMGPLALTSDKQIPINAQCAVFAESEVVGLIHANTAKSDISKAIHDAMAGRIASMIRRIGVNEDVVLIGGVGCNTGFLAALKRELRIENIYVPTFPEFGAALGAAVIAAQKT